MTNALTLGPQYGTVFRPWLSDARFMACLPFTLKEEGGNSNDRHDPGGRTSRGITQREYDRYRTQHGAALRTVYIMTDDEMHDIYFHEYWSPHCDQVPAGLDLSLFDNAVNEGPYRATVMLQRAIGASDDGQFGPETERAIASHTDVPSVRLFIEHYASQRKQFYYGLSTFKYFGKDWIARTEHIEAASLAMVAA